MKKEINKSIKEQITDTLTSRAVIASLLFAVALWAYSSLNEEYTTRIIVPLEVKLPSTRALEEGLPEEISLEVKGTGWHLFNIYFFNTSENCFIDLSGKYITDSIYTISRAEILKGIRNLMNLHASDVSPEYMQLVTGRVTQKDVPVIPDLNIIPRDGFTLAEQTRVQPQRVTIRGNDKIIKHIDSWSTTQETLKDVYQDIILDIPLKDSLHGIVETLPNTVTLSTKVEQFAETTIYDVPVRVRGGVLTKEHTLSSRKIDITVRAAASVLDNLTPDRFIVTLDYNKVLSDSTGILIPDIESRDKLQVLQIYPEVIYHYKRFKETLIANM